MGQDRSIDGHLPPIEPIPFSGKPTAPVDVPRATTPETSPEWGIAEWPSSTKLPPARFVRSEHEPAAITPPPPKPERYGPTTATGRRIGVAETHELIHVGGFADPRLSPVEYAWHQLATLYVEHNLWTDIDGNPLPYPEDQPS